MEQSIFASFFFRKRRRFPFYPDRLRQPRRLLLASRANASGAHRLPEQEALEHRAALLQQDRALARRSPPPPRPRPAPALRAMPRIARTIARLVLLPSRSRTNDASTLISSNGRSLAAGPARRSRCRSRRARSPGRRASARPCARAASHSRITSSVSSSIRQARRQRHLVHQRAHLAREARCAELARADVHRQPQRRAAPGWSCQDAAMRQPAPQHPARQLAGQSGAPEPAAGTRPGARASPRRVTPAQQRLAAAQPCRRRRAAAARAARAPAPASARRMPTASAPAGWSSASCSLRVEQPAAPRPAALGRVHGDVGAAHHLARHQLWARRTGRRRCWRGSGTPAPAAGQGWSTARCRRPAQRSARAAASAASVASPLQHHHELVAAEPADHGVLRSRRQAGQPTAPPPPAAGRPRRGRGCRSAA